MILRYYCLGCDDWGWGMWDIMHVYVHSVIRLNRIWWKVCQCRVTGILMWYNSRVLFKCVPPQNIFSETSTWLDSTQWNTTGNSRGGSRWRLAEVTGGGHTRRPSPRVLTHTRQWFILNLRTAHWISLFISAKLRVWFTHTWGFSKCLVVSPPGMRILYSNSC